MDQEDIVKFLIITVRSFIQDKLLDKEQRIQQKEQCAERLAAEDGNLDKDIEIRYSDQAVLANLDWGIDALEEAINTLNIETKMARLDYAEKMLQVCAMLNSNERTAGVPNSYLSAWAHLNLSYLSLLRNIVDNAILYVLEMFSVDPFFSRIDFVPELWKSLFLPHLSSVIGWYTQERHRIMMDAIPDSSDLSFTMDFDQYSNGSLVLSMRPDQAEKMQKLEELYGRSLDDNTRLFAKYYRDCMNNDSSPSKQMIHMFPIAEPPMTPLHEVSRSIPDYVKFGPILPRSAGFSPILKAKEASRSNQSLENSTTCNPQTKGENSEENGYKSVNEPDLYPQSKDRSLNVESSSISINEAEAWVRVKSVTTKSQRESPRTISPMDSPKTPVVSSPYPNRQCRTEATPVSRLLSRRIVECPPLSGSPVSYHDSSISSANSDGEEIEQPKIVRKSSSRASSNSRSLETRSFNGSDEVSRSWISLPTSEISTPQSRPPKDFVCPITGQIFHDPVTLETGQTYERKAIEEWINRGNTSCPITRQSLSATALPKTNYVLKRLITSWKEQHPDVAHELSYTDILRSCLSSPSGRSSESSPSRSYHLPSSKSMIGKNERTPRRFTQAVSRSSPSGIISHAAVEKIVEELKPYISCLCTSEDLSECEAAVLKVAKIWKGSKTNSRIHSYISSPTVVTGLIEILSASLNRDVLRTTIYILTELIYTDDSNSQTLTSVDSDFDSLAALLENGLAETAVLIYLLKPSLSQLSTRNLIPSLTHIISSKDEDSDDLPFEIAVKDAALSLLEQIITGSAESHQTFIAMDITSSGGIPALLRCVDRVDRRQSVLSILLCCMRSDKSCRNVIANRIELYPILDLLHAGSDSAKVICIEFFSELVQVSRRSVCNKILQIIKDEGAFSTMHTLLVYLQMSSIDQKPAIAMLLLQLDLLVEPRKMSIYREEAIEALIEALGRKDFPASQLMALDALSALAGHLTPSGKSYIREWLLNIAGFSQPYNALMKGEKPEIHEMKEEEKVATSWGKRLAFVLCTHEKGIIFDAIKECLTSNSIEIAKTCLIMGTWLVHTLYKFPDIGIRDVARKSLLDHFINILQSSKSLEDKILATLAIRGFINDPGALDELSVYAKTIFKSLRKLKRHCTISSDILKTLMILPSIDTEELWCCTECPELDTSMNGEVLSILCVKSRIISSHSDGTIKVWYIGKRNPRLIQEARGHTKAVTCLYVSSSCDKLFSGSLDKTIRVWTIKQEEIHCVQVHDVKEPVLEMIANSEFACFTSQGTGVKVYNWSGVPKHVNFSKHVKCLASSGDKLYCGCTGYTIQEVDINTQISTTFYSGTRKLLGKQTIYSLHSFNDLLFVGGSSVDGIAGKTDRVAAEHDYRGERLSTKTITSSLPHIYLQRRFRVTMQVEVFSITSNAAIGSLSTGFDIHRINVNDDFVFTASRCGTIEVWLKERLTKIASIKIGSEGHAKLTSIASDVDGEMLFAGYSDGKIQAWSLD